MLPNPFDPQNRFVLSDFTNTPAFSSFLPGIAGQMGIPMWVFYVNRGQCITSFGVESKDSPIMEFYSANKAYQNTPYVGFRTFLRIIHATETQTYEPFSPLTSPPVSRTMFIGMNELEIEEQNEPIGLQTNVRYFSIPGENYAGLARSVTIRNTSSSPIDLEILDGMPVIIPFGVNNTMLKEIGRTAEAWMQVINLEQDIPFYRVQASIEDKPEVDTFESGNFALAFIDPQSGQNALLSQAFIDPEVIFGQDTSLTLPKGFYQNTLSGISKKTQIACGKTPSAMFGTEVHLQPSASITLYSIYGHIDDLAALNQDSKRWLSAAYFNAKREEAQQIASDLTDVIATYTSSPLFDGYCRQTFLDNVLRGGWPISIGKSKSIYYIYSRKHGDPERDYNAFFLAAEFYSQGNGNYRDVIQNRCNDVFFNPAVQAHNIETFMSLIQADGYNPLVVHGSQFTVPEDRLADILSLVNDPQPLEKLLSRAFTPGELLKTITFHNIALAIPAQDFLSLVIDQANQYTQAKFGEGFWIDHWTYNLDLIESYLGIYPEHASDLLFKINISFYDSPAHVNPRDQKYTLTKNGPRQLNALAHSPVKERLLADRAVFPNLMRTKNGKGEIYRTNLFTKLFILAIVKFSTLDPEGMGIEMEAGKPGWCDAVNGLPALFASSLPESFELKRLLLFLIQVIQEQRSFTITLPIEVHRLLDEIINQLVVMNHSTDPQREFHYWDAVASAREAYRDEIQMGFSGVEQTLPSEIQGAHLEALLNKVESGLARAQRINDGIPPTYFTYQVEEYEALPLPGGTSKADTAPDHFRVKRFKPNVLPLFLEGPVRALKVASQEEATALFQHVRGSDLYDRKLKMYKVNASLEDQPHDIGRARAFTPGWLENESIWLHMEYKYLLEVLKAGLYDEFFEDFKNALIPFQDPAIYQRSPLENSSFLVSSAHPDESRHGAGYVARLSGATAEFLSMWKIMMAGKEPFKVIDGELTLELVPILPGWLFTEAGQVSFKFLGSCTVTYHNPGRWDTYKNNLRPYQFVLHKKDQQSIEIQDNRLKSPHAEDIRAGRITHLEVFFKT